MLGPVIAFLVIGLLFSQALCSLRDNNRHDELPSFPQQEKQDDCGLVEEGDV